MGFGPSGTNQLAQLIQYRTTVREVVGSNPGQTNTYIVGSLKNWGESAAFVMTSANG